MAKLAVLKLDGDFEQGFRVTLEIATEGDRAFTEIGGMLPPVPELVTQYSHWQSAYRGLGKATRAIKAKKVKFDGSIKTQRQECQDLGLRLKSHLNSWLKSESFLSIREQWLEKISTSEEVRVLIRTENPQLRQLPWHLWDLLERYPSAEIALGAIAYEKPNLVKTNTYTNKIKILAILGNQDGIDVQKDRQLLENLPKAETTFLVQPQRQDLTDQLWEQSWDILFFDGHSKSEGETGRIYINQTDSLTIEEVELAIKKAVERGLKIAIFNSCDGLGLARKLEQLNIPQIIVMREPVPDKVAQEFLKYFIKSFASGTSFYLAVQEARKKLEGLEGDFPCASWLPAICQNPATVPPTWQQLRGSDRLKFQTPLIASLVITILVMAVRQLGILQALEFQAFDLLMRLRPNQGIDARLLVVEATEEDINRYGFPLPDGILAEAIAKLNLYQPRVIGLDIFRAQSVQFGNAALVSQFQHNNKLIAICSASETNNPNKPGIKPPPKLPENRLGFSDVLVDPDGILRRHLVFMTPHHTDPCATNYSFSVRVALHYLAADGIYPQLIGNNKVKLGKTVLKPLKLDTGGYQNLDNRGFQILLNYRASADIARRVRISEVLSGKIKADWVKNRVVLIGVTAPISSDDFYTPYSAMKWPYEKMPGLIVQAEMVSQIISAVLDNRPILWVWNPWGEAIWVWSWAIVGGAIACCYKRILYWGLATGATISILSGLCFGFLIQGGWVPLVPSALALVATGGCATLARTLEIRLQFFAKLPLKFQ
ncbi:CHASE2 domain-containing protein [Microseira wollei]|uniref:Chase2 sensor protein n=1 Tax=Microseira wollei NIES-4236 TaxID=2530354 RepID=A0AAV3WHU3_9CYAN|nr:CHASE2 domain-containing protein [Microseira wollei]GET38724.1 putative Chase2 sensor protein [Microseira wollei NIES-4236]